MFGNNGQKLESIVGANSDFTGDFHASGTVRVDGMVKGLIHGEFVILSETAMVKGDIKGKTVIVGGKVEGNVFAQEKVEIKSKGTVSGEIHTKKFCVIEGGTLNGKIYMVPEEPQPISLTERISEKEQSLKPS
jgi:cytoskeletal protein CcmA (bactofilin family)